MIYAVSWKSSTDVSERGVSVNYPLVGIKLLWISNWSGVGLHDGFEQSKFKLLDR